MENEHSELIIGYLQGRLQGRSLDDFYAWVNESADNKKLFFETKALYEACAPSRGASEIHDSWLRLLDKRKSRQRKRYSLLTRISTYAAVAMFAALLLLCLSFLRENMTTGLPVMSVETGLKRMLLFCRTEPASVSEPGLLSLMIPVMVSPNVSCNWKGKPILK